METVKNKTNPERKANGELSVKQDKPLKPAHVNGVFTIKPRGLLGALKGKVVLHGTPEEVFDLN